MSSAHKNVIVKTSMVPRTWDYVYTPPVRDRFEALMGYALAGPPSEDPVAVARSLAGAEVILSTWGGVQIDAQVLDECPHLKLVVHAAGSVKGLVSDALVARGVQVSSAVGVNGASVAKFTAGIILCELKELHAQNQAVRTLGPEARATGNMEFGGGYFGHSIGLVGDGRIARTLLDLLKPFDLDIRIASDYFTAQDEAHYGAKRVSVEEAFSCKVVSLHHADIPQNWNIANGKTIALIPAGGTLINTARGRLIDEAALIERLRKNDLTAYLDVTHPEPPVAGHPFYTLPNVVLTPHIAGCAGKETELMGQFAIDELERYLQGRPLKGLIDLATVKDRA